ncbi:hypothetical protein B0T16DRAFT_381439 [Cercophora newfieldiana]|uniref:AB hydrolase-1 domain-containing protein n=1 Tax=Cercophora newfieldiana TaxID=92897 RepID=A0AA39XXP8_9PEZI|nr:hypothetical protein B0T16DRAFT_381439 [Cercophora newfieldiana]
MESFTLTLANGATLTGLSNLPPASASASKHRPLVVGLHGASYGATYFDVDAKHTALLTSNALSVPFVAVNRPGYLGSTSIYPLSASSSDPETHGAWLHKYILPALWKEFGLPQGCNSLVLHCHSLASPGGVIAASYHASSPDPEYPLAGIIFSGFGIHLIPDSGPKQDPDAPPVEFLEFPQQIKDAIMMPPGTCHPDVYTHHDRLNTRFPMQEVGDIHTVWLPRVRGEWAKDVKVPVMFGIAERDCYWEATREHVDGMRGMFRASPRVEGGVVRGAPHNIEMSYWAQGWYGRCFGFGLECAASFGVARDGQ